MRSCSAFKRCQFQFKERMRSKTSLLSQPTVTNILVASSLESSKNLAPTELSLSKMAKLWKLKSNTSKVSSGIEVSSLHISLLTPRPLRLNSKSHWYYSLTRRSAMFNRSSSSWNTPVKTRDNFSLLLRTSMERLSPLSSSTS
jgi:hypothetical protein